MSRPFGARAAAAPVSESSGAPTLADALALILGPLDDAWPGRVFLDVKEINPPCLYLHPPVINFVGLGPGRFTAEFVLLFVTGNSGARRVAYAELSAMLDQFHAVLPGRGVTARPADIFAADGSSVLAGYELSWTERLRGVH
jgi:hypothetical protein